jgi:hypothetical protein
MIPLQSDDNYHLPHHHCRHLQSSLRNGHNLISILKKFNSTAVIPYPECEKIHPKLSFRGHLRCRRLLSGTTRSRHPFIIDTQQRPQ